MINELKLLRLSGYTRPFDRVVLFTTLGRSASLNYKYKKSHLAFGKAENLLRGLKNRSKSTRALKAFFALNYGVSLGYSGKTAESKKYLSMAEKLHLKLDAIEDLTRLKLYEIDLGIYSSLTGYTSVKNELENLKVRFAKINLEEEHFNLRMAVLNYLIYRKNGTRDNLRKSHSYFISELESSKVFNYWAFWAQCGAITTAHYLGKKYRWAIKDTPPNGISYANRFPPIIIIIVQSEMINGNYKRAWEKLRRFETHIKNMLREFPEDEDYKKFILENYTEVVKERIMVALEERDWLDDQKMNRIIRANEIQQNRLLQLKSELKIGTDLETNITELIKKMAPSKGKTGLIYVTGEFTENGKRKTVLMIRPDITKRDARILSLEPSRVSDVMRKFLVARTGKEQKRLLSKLGKMFLSLKEILMCDKVIIVPNSSFLQIPIHMFMLESKYLFEHTKVSYLPSLRLAAAADDHKKVNKSPKLCIFYTSEEMLSIKEAEEIKKILPKAILVPDPTEDDLIKYSTRANMIHVIAHHRNGKVHFRNSSYVADEFLGALRGHKSLVVMNVCGSRIRNSTGPPISHESIAHYLLEKGHNCVIAHNWDLAQEASIKFSQTFYLNLFSKGSVLDAFNFSLQQLNGLEPVKYGGYIFWGNHLLKFSGDFGRTGK